MWQPNLSWITEELAIGGSFPAERAEALARDHAVRAVIDLRIEACDDEHVLRRHGITFLHLPTLDCHGVTTPMIDDGVEFAARHLGHGERVLIHCEHGIGRSTTLALCVLVERGLEPLAALELAKQRRSVVSPSPQQYAAWVAWLHLHRARRQLTWEVPDFERFCKIAYRHLAVG